MKKQLFTIKQYADLHEIGKRTLHFYDEIGLFSPEIKKENGYRYYSLSQGSTLEMILTLRELDMSIDEIKHYIEKPNPTDFHKLLDSKKKQVNKKIKELNEIKDLLQLKQDQLKYLKEDFTSIKVVPCQKKNYTMTFINNAEKSYIDALIEHGKSLPHHLFNMELGTINNVENLKKGIYNHTFGIFSNTGKQKGNFIREAGNYIQAFHIGDFNDMTPTYLRILNYCQLNNIKLEGYCYEVGINDLCIMSFDEYVTMVEIKIAD